MDTLLFTVSESDWIMFVHCLVTCHLHAELFAQAQQHHFLLTNNQILCVNFAVHLGLCNIASILFITGSAVTDKRAKKKIKNQNSARSLAHGHIVRLFCVTSSTQSSSSFVLSTTAAALAKYGTSEEDTRRSNRSWSGICISCNHEEYLNVKHTENWLHRTNEKKEGLVRGSRFRAKKITAVDGAVWLKYISPQCTHTHTFHHRHVAD